MVLFHFTSERHLNAIARQGLTVGGVPTDLRKGLGRVGIWLTSGETAEGHGLENSVADKTRFRLAVEIDADARALHRWLDWAPLNFDPMSIEALQRNGSGYQSWFVYFGYIEPESIVSCVDMATGIEVADWRDRPPDPFDVPAVPYWRRAAWHKNLLKQVARALVAQAQ